MRSFAARSLSAIRSVSATIALSASRALPSLPVSSPLRLEYSRNRSAPIRLLPSENG
jgi:hypothetical protein